MSLYKNDTLETLHPALKSLYDQTKKVDIFIQQDGIISEEVEVFLNKELSDKKIKFLGKRDENKGLAYSLNELLEQVFPYYEYIARMDADDISISDRIEQQFDFMEKHLNIDVVGAFIEEFSEEIEYSNIVKYPLSHDEMFDFFKKRVPLAHVSAFFRKSFFEKAGFYPEESLTNEDTLLWMNGFKNDCQFSNLSIILVNVRIGKSFFKRRGGLSKPLSDLKDRIKVIQTLGYNYDAYIYALGVFIVNISPAWIKKILYKRLR